MKTFDLSPRNLSESGISMEFATIIAIHVSAYNRFGYETDLDVKRLSISDHLEAEFVSQYYKLPSSQNDVTHILCRVGEPVPTWRLFNQFEALLNVSRQKYSSIERFLGSEVMLSFKMAAHYGPVAIYKRGECIQFFGDAIVKAKQLMYNSLDARTYLLISEDLEKIDGLSPVLQGRSRIAAGQICEVYGDQVPTCFVYYDFSS